MNEDNVLIDHLIGAAEKVRETVAQALRKINPQQHDTFKERVLGNICELTNEAINDTFRVFEEKICQSVQNYSATLNAVHLFFKQ